MDNKRMKIFADKKLISYLRMEIVTETRREIIYSQNFFEFYETLADRAKEKIKYATTILETLNPVPTKFVKKLTGTDFYELRISVDNEIRVILFSADDKNINIATKVLFLNGFIKKSTKDYNKEIEKAVNILRNLL